MTAMINNEIGESRSAKRYKTVPSNSAWHARQQRQAMPGLRGDAAALKHQWLRQHKTAAKHRRSGQQARASATREAKSHKAAE